MKRNMTYRGDKEKKSEVIVQTKEKKLSFYKIHDAALNTWKNKINPTTMIPTAILRNQAQKIASNRPSIPKIAQNRHGSCSWTRPLGNAFSARVTLEPSFSRASIYPFSRVLMDSKVGDGGSSKEVKSPGGRSVGVVGFWGIGEDDLGRSVKLLLSLDATLCVGGFGRGLLGLGVSMSNTRNQWDSG